MSRRPGSKTKNVTDEILVVGDQPRRSDGTFLPGRDSAKGARFEYSDEDIALYKEQFIEVYRKTFNATAAARGIGVHYVTLRNWAQRDSEFKQKWELTKRECMDNLEGALYSKALGEGKDSTTAAIMLLNAHRPKRYRPKHEGGTSGNVTFQFILGKSPESKSLPDGKEISIKAEES